MNALGNKRFAVSSGNQVAIAAATTLATDEGAPFRTLFIHGPGGSGKTHLLHTVEAMHREAHPSSSRLFINAGELMRWPEKLDQELTGTDLLLIDDLDVVAKSGATQGNLVHVIDTIERLAMGRVAMTSSFTQRDLNGICPRLMSRLYAAAPVGIAKPGEQLRAEIIRSEIEHWGLHLSEVLVTMLARLLPHDGHIIVGAARRVALHVQATGKEPGEAEVLMKLRDSINLAQHIAVAVIQNHTAAHFHVPAREMTSQRRGRDVARPRQVSMYLSKRLTPKSLPDIGRLHGGRDHTTVIHAVRRIETLRASDAELDSSIRVIERELTH